MSEPPALPPDAAAPASQPAPRRLVERRDRFFPPPPPPPARAARQRPDRQHAPAPPARPSLSGRPWGAVELRAGKWSAEEIAYADAVARDFRRGSLVGCPDGAMLRALLASLLNCTPMRVSKRFAGEAAMGKRAYVDDPAARAAGAGAGPRPARGPRRSRPAPCLLYTSPSPRDKRQSRMPSSA